ncbi:MAG: acetoin:2,6-dichlorophenolindophenol oxidoreductase subunit alpha [Thermosediminibacterales bacterium]|jgi:pyruvate dehydrogenase E1 component alpha subunit|nr:acetoin:2,6-dichlorophenolindophenol oxidoreductase subunit alpha [Thermosediminibacterales bacterium]
MKFNPEDSKTAYRTMLKIRLFEEETVKLYQSGAMHGLAHPCIGQEAVAVGASFDLTKEDYVITTHRGHGHLIARGADIKKIMAEIMGRKTGYCKGKGGSMHIADFSKGILGANGIVGGGIPISVGAALSQKKKGLKNVTVCFFGDGASNQGTFHESLNMASIWKLPVIYVCENNLYGLSMRQTSHQNIKNISERAKAYGIPGYTVDGNDVEAVRECMQKAIERAKNGEGPTLIECKTYRWTGHHAGDAMNGIAYRSREEMEAWKQKCPIKSYEKKLLERGIIDKDFIRKTRDELEKEIKEAIEYGENSPYPEPHEIFEDVLAQ